MNKKSVRSAANNSFVQYSLFSAPLTQHNSQSSLADAILDDTPQQQPDTSPAVPAATAVDELTQTSMAVQQHYPPTTPGDMSMPSTGPMHHQTAAAEHDQPEEYHQQMPRGRREREVLAKSREAPARNPSTCYQQRTQHEQHCRYRL